MTLRENLDRWTGPVKILLYIMYNIFDVSLVSARNKMYEVATRVHFFSETSKKSKMVYIIGLNVVCAIHFITVAKVKCNAWE